MKQTDRSEQKNDLISIIVPAYNAAPYLERAMTSVLRQTYDNWELLVIDGHSADDTVAIGERLAAQDARIRIFREEENNGVSAGRNRGIEEAKGSLLFFLDADDWLLPDCLERLYDDLQETGADIAGCNFASMTGADRNTLPASSEQSNQNVDSSQLSSKLSVTEEQDAMAGADTTLHIIAGPDFLRDGILGGDTRCWGKLYRRELLQNHRFRTDFTIGEDMLFLLDAASSAKTIAEDSYPGYCYFTNPSGAMLRPFRESDIDEIRCWQQVLEIVQNRNESAETKEKAAGRVLVACMLTAGKLSALSKDERRGHERLIQDIRATLQQTLSIPGAFAGLDKGYRLKVRMFRHFPGLYFSLYHRLHTV